MLKPQTHLRMALGVAAYLLALPGNQVAVGDTVVGGIISGDTQWVAAESPYCITASNLLVSSGATLSIDPGVVVKFGSGRAMLVEGAIEANGTSGSGIHFTSSSTSPAPGDWGNIYLSPGAVGNFRYCTVEYAGYGDTEGVLHFQDVAGTVEHSILQYNDTSAIYIASYTREIAPPAIADNIIRHNRSDEYGGGIRAYPSYKMVFPLRIQDNVIYDNEARHAGGALHVSSSGGAPVEITGNRMYENRAGSGGAVSTHNISGEISENILTGNTAAQGAALFLDSVGSSLQVTDNHVVGNLLPEGRDGAAVWLDYTYEGASLTLNNIYGNAGYELWNADDIGSPHLDATLNYWGTTDEAAIAQGIWDWFDDASLAIVDYAPILTERRPIPEPATLALLALGGLGALLHGRRHGKR